MTLKCHMQLSYSVTWISPDIWYVSCSVFYITYTYLASLPLPLFGAVLGELLSQLHVYVLIIWREQKQTRKGLTTVRTAPLLCCHLRSVCVRVCACAGLVPEVKDNFKESASERKKKSLHHTGGILYCTEPLVPSGVCVFCRSLCHVSIFSPSMSWAALMIHQACRESTQALGDSK